MLMIGITLSVTVLLGIFYYGGLMDAWLQWRKRTA